MREPGPYSVRFIPLDLTDDTRNWAVPSDLFLPDSPDGIEQSIPVLIFSHGLGHSRVYFRDVAEYLASHGIAVAMPDHVGSHWLMRTDGQENPIVIGLKNERGFPQAQ